MVKKKKDLPELPEGYKWMWVHSKEYWAAFHSKTGQFIHPGQGAVATLVDAANEDGD